MRFTIDVIARVRIMDEEILKLHRYQKMRSFGLPTNQLKFQYIIALY